MNRTPSPPTARLTDIPAKPRDAGSGLLAFSRRPDAFGPGRPRHLDEPGAFDLLRTGF